jgi:hypothetical protein
MAIASTMPTCSTPFRNVFRIGTIHTLPQTPAIRTIAVATATSQKPESMLPRKPEPPQ